MFKLENEVMKKIDSELESQKATNNYEYVLHASPNCMGCNYSCKGGCNGTCKTAIGGTVY